MLEAVVNKEYKTKIIFWITCNFVNKRVEGCPGVWTRSFFFLNRISLRAWSFLQLPQKSLQALLGCWTSIVLYPHREVPFIIKWEHYSWTSTSQSLRYFKLKSFTLVGIFSFNKYSLFRAPRQLKVQYFSFSLRPQLYFKDKHNSFRVLQHCRLHYHSHESLNTAMKTVCLISRRVLHLIISTLYTLVLLIHLVLFLINYLILIILR